jgi:hypothetical protein
LSQLPYHALYQLCPDESVLKELDSSLDLDNWTGPDFSRLSDAARTAKTILPPNPTEIMTKAIRDSGGPVVGPDDDDIAHLKLVDQMQTLHIDPSEKRFFGKSSGAMLVQAAIDLKQEYSGSNENVVHELLGAIRPEFWTIRPVRYQQLLCYPAFTDHDVVGKALGSCRSPCIHLPGR